MRFHESKNVDGVDILVAMDLILVLVVVLDMFSLWIWLANPTNPVELVWKMMAGTSGAFRTLCRLGAVGRHRGSVKMHDRGKDERTTTYLAKKKREEIFLSLFCWFFTLYRYCCSIA